MEKLNGKQQRILLWGAGQVLARCVALLKYLESIGDIEVIGITCNEGYFSYMYGYPFIAKEQIKECIFDGVFVAIGKRGLQASQNELLRLGVGEDQLIPAEAVAIPGFTFMRYLEWKKRKITIVANNCWGGVTYHFFRSQFYSPFINMFIGEDDEFIRLCKNFPDYMKYQIILERISHNPVEGYDYPVYTLNDIHLDMNHYPDFDAAKSIWEKRKNRINWQDIFIMMYTKTPQSAVAFEDIPYPHKVCFTSFPTDCPSAVYVDVCKKQSMGNKMFWEIILGMASEKFPFYDPWELLLHCDRNARFISS